MSKQTSFLIAATLAFCLPACGGGGGSNSANNPAGPSGSGSAPAAGAWTGTMTRPGGLGTLSVRWEARSGTVTGLPGLTGLMTITNGAASVNVNASSVIGGNDSLGYKLTLNFTANTGDFPAFPSCNAHGNNAGSQDGDPFASPYTTIAIPAFSVSFNNCRGFIDTGYANAQTNSLMETVQLNMHK